MRKFIISDLHGNGEVYDSIMGYLDNISLVEDIELYINGDLIDRGLDSFRMLEDVKRRIDEDDRIKIHYLGGNHELMMYNALSKDSINKASAHDDWMANGGCLIMGMLEMMDLEEGLAKEEELVNFLGRLEIYHKFEETIRGNNLLLVHAQAPHEIKDICNLHIGDDSDEVFDAVWTRKEIRQRLIFGHGDIIGYNRIGKEGYYTIIGHTPNKSDLGFSFDREENVLNIDGNCAYYALGAFKYNRVPLVEVKEGYLEILVFNHFNKIVNGFYHDGRLEKMTDEELENRRIYIDHTYDDRGLEEKLKLKEYLR